MARTDEVDLSVQIEAKLATLEKQMARADAIAAKGFKSMQRNAEQASQKMERSIAAATSRIATSLGSIGKGLAVGAIASLGLDSARNVAKLADEYRGLQNQLRDAGRSGADLDQTFGSLFAISQKQGAALGSLVGLYRDAANAGETLNATEADRLKFAEGVANALRIEGKSATEAAGPLQQLGQLLGAGTVRAEEFNSVGEGMRPVLQAVADGMLDAGGSIAKLRSLMLDGKVSSEAFFRSFLAGSDQLAARADKAEVRVSGSMNRIGNAMIVLIGNLDDVTGSSTNAAKNLDAVAAVIEKLPGYLDAAVKGFRELRDYLSSIGNSDIFKKINDALGYSDPDFLRSKGLTPIGDRSSSRVGDAFSDTAGSGTVSADKASRVVGEAADTAKISLKDFAVSADKAAALADKLGKAFPDGAVSRYVNDVVSAESGGRANAKNPNSSATGVGQFIESTWLRLFQQNFPDRASSMSNAAILALRKDADISKALIEAYATENADVLRKAGVSVNEAALHLSHFLGAGDAAKVLSAAPGTPLAGLISSKSIAANPTILGGGKTVDDARAYAERRATNTRQAAGNFTPAETESQNQLKAYQELLASGQAFIAEQPAEQSALGKTAQAAAKARFEQQLLAEAMRQGIALSPEQRAKLSELAAGMAEVETATNKAAASQDQMRATQDFLKNGVAGFFTSVIDGSATVEDALGRLLASLADAALQGRRFSALDRLGAC